MLVTTGLRDELPDIPGVRERWGRDLLHCPYCHGYEVRDQPLGVLGGTPEALAHAHLVRQWSDDVVLFAHGDALTADAARAARRPRHRRRRRPGRPPGRRGRPADRRRARRRPASCPGPRCSSGRGSCPTTTCSTGLGCAIDDNGWVVADATGRTSVPGVWAAGNAVNPRAQVITAAGEGSAAAIAINTDLVDEDVAIAVTRLPARPARLSLAVHASSLGTTITQPHHQEHHHVQRTPRPAHDARTSPVGPPTKHQLALMIWVAVFPTLTVLNLTLGHWLADLGPVLRTFVLATVAVPIVIYGLMPRLHRVRVLMLSRRMA